VTSGDGETVSTDRLFESDLLTLIVTEGVLVTDSETVSEFESDTLVEPD